MENECYYSKIRFPVLYCTDLGMEGLVEKNNLSVSTLSVP